jgi:hypothetical protein
MPGGLETSSVDDSKTLFQPPFAQGAAAEVKSSSIESTSAPSAERSEVAASRIDTVLERE